MSLNAMQYISKPKPVIDALVMRLYCYFLIQYKSYAAAQLQMIIQTESASFS